MAFTGKAHRALCGEVVRSLKGLAPNQNRAWVLWGPGGAGKTRTAVEVALALQAVGWAQPLPIWSRPDRPTLLIVDYAEQRPAKIRPNGLWPTVGLRRPERRSSHRRESVG